MLIYYYYLEKRKNKFVVVLYMNYYAKYVFILIIMLVLGYVFDKYKKDEAINDKMDHYELIKKHLLNDSTLAQTDKPILWVHVTFETNARWWPHFASRNTQCLNQPYQYQIHNQRRIGSKTKTTIADPHKDNHVNKAQHRRPFTSLNRICTKIRTNCALFHHG